ncbi:MAG: DNA repair protein RecO [Oscillospiraceae bacterium]
MLITTYGIVIRERSIGENDKFIDVLTKDLGVIELSAKGVKKITSKSFSSAQLFAYSKFCLNKKNDRYYINSAEPVHIFYNLRLDVESFALASYFCEIILHTITSEQSANSVTRLFLNTLYFLEEGKHPKCLLKSIFELRLVSEIGMMPDILACHSCLCYQTPVMYFKIDKGMIFCENCYNRAGDAVEINSSVLHAIRYICLTDFEKLWSFKLSDNAQKSLSQITEKYILSHTERHFKTLDFYKELENTFNG